MKKRVLVTGANGFIGKNLTVRLAEAGYEVVKFVRKDSIFKLEDDLFTTDFVFHLAGENKPKDPAEFEHVNVELTKKLCEAASKSQVPARICFASSTHADKDTPYGESKRKAERVLESYARQTGVGVKILRLPGVFGKWCKPHYNSVVSTFCYNIVNRIPIKVDDPTALVDLVYVDDLIDQLIDLEKDVAPGLNYHRVENVYSLAVGKLENHLSSFHAHRKGLWVDQVGKGLVRALYATYLTYLPPSDFIYKLHVNDDNRGRFAEVLKTQESGQLSVFTVKPGKTRGCHYHHTKNEKFIVVSGTVLFSFRNILSDEIYTKKVSGAALRVVETVPGWAHNIKNIGSTEAIVVLWSNEVFDSQKPDTIPSKVV